MFSPLELELKQQIERIRNSVSGFKRLLADMKPGPVCKLIGHNCRHNGAHYTGLVPWLRDLL